MKNTIILLALSALALAGCEKVAVNCNYRITPYLQMADQGDTTYAAGVVAYAFYADTALWAVTDYASAAAGVLTSRTGAGTMNYAVRTMQDAESYLNLGPITSKPLFVVVCDTRQGVYAWRQAPMEDNIAQVDVAVMFRPWRSDTTYLEQKWRMVNPPVP